MAAFIYNGGTEFDETELPAAVTIFGIKFIQEVPKHVTRDLFKTDAAFNHALGKLKAHPHFSALDDSVQEVIVPKPKGWPKGKPRKPVVEATDVDPSEFKDAAE
jgi:hypothetical protein